MSKIVAFLKNESGATAIEYGLIAAGISVAIIGTVTTLGSRLTTTFSSVSSALSGEFASHRGEPLKKPPGTAASCFSKGRRLSGWRGSRARSAARCA